MTDTNPVTSARTTKAREHADTASECSLAAAEKMAAGNHTDALFCAASAFFAAAQASVLADKEEAASGKVAGPVRIEANRGSEAASVAADTATHVE